MEVDSSLSSKGLRMKPNGSLCFARSRVLESEWAVRYITGALCRRRISSAASMPSIDPVRRMSISTKIGCSLQAISTASSPAPLIRLPRSPVSAACLAMSAADDRFVFNDQNGGFTHDGIPFTLKLIWNSVPGPGPVCTVPRICLASICTRRRPSDVDCRQSRSAGRPTPLSLTRRQTAPVCGIVLQGHGNFTAAATGKGVFDGVAGQFVQDQSAMHGHIDRQN